MKISSIKFENFRQFADTKITLQTNPGGSYDLVVGENSRGKSTLMAAIAFAFHGDRELLKENPEFIANDEEYQKLADGETIGVSTSIEFEYGSPSESYFLKRYVKLEKNGSKPNVVGETLTLKNLTTQESVTPAERWVNRNFPQSMTKFLLFPGERIADFFGLQNATRIENDVRLLSGLDKIHPALEAGKLIHRRIESSLASIPGQPELTHLMDRCNGTRGALETRKNELADKKNELQGLMAEYESLAKLQREDAKESDRIRLIASVRLQIEEASQKVSKYEAEITKLVASGGWLALYSAEARKAHDTVKALSGTGYLQGVSVAALEQIQASNICICGRHLDDASSLEHVQTLAHSQARQGQIMHLLSLLDFAEEGILSPAVAAQNWIATQRAAMEVAYQLEAMETQLGQLLSEGDGSPAEKLMTQRASRLIELETIVPAKKQEISGLEDEVASTESMLQSLENELNLLKDSSTNEGKLLRQRNAIANVMKSIELEASNFHSNLRSMVERDLSRQLPKLWDEPDLRCKVTPTFGIRLEKYGIPYSPASGQSALEAFAFISALYKSARELTLGWTNETSGLSLPLVLDAPFSTLGERYSRLALELLGNTFPQIILLLRPDHAQTIIQNFGVENLSSQSAMTRYSKEIGDDVHSSFGSKRLPDIVKNSTKNRTEIWSLEGTWPTSE